MKYTFLDYIGLCIPKNKVRKLCQAMELSERETEFVLTRYCDKVAADVIDFIPYTEQRTLVPSLETRTIAWFWDNLDFFNPHEVMSLLQKMSSKS